MPVAQELVFFTQKYVQDCKFCRKLQMTVLDHFYSQTLCNRHLTTVFYSVDVEIIPSPSVLVKTGQARKLYNMHAALVLTLLTNMMCGRPL